MKHLKYIDGAWPRRA